MKAKIYPSPQPLSSTLDRPPAKHTQYIIITVTRYMHREVRCYTKKQGWNLFRKTPHTEETLSKSYRSDKKQMLLFSQKGLFAPNSPNSLSQHTHACTHTNVHTHTRLYLHKVYI